jgi:hypothetical protein
MKPTHERRITHSTHTHTHTCALSRTGSYNAHSPLSQRSLVHKEHSSHGLILRWWKLLRELFSRRTTSRTCCGLRERDVLEVPLPVYSLCVADAQAMEVFISRSPLSMWFSLCVYLLSHLKPPSCLFHLFSLFSLISLSLSLVLLSSTSVYTHSSVFKENLRIA